MNARPRTLGDVRQRLMRLLQNDSKFTFVNTRLILQTGVDLREISPDDEALVPEVTAALAEMGFPVDPGREGDER